MKKKRQTWFWGWIFVCFFALILIPFLVFKELTTIEMSQEISKLEEQNAILRMEKKNFAEQNAKLRVENGELLWQMHSDLDATRETIARNSKDELAQEHYSSRYKIPDDVECLFVFWDDTGGNWAGWGEDILHAPNYWGGVIKKPECPYKCLFSGRRDLAPYADAILFSPGSMWGRSYESHMVILPEKRPGQKFFIYGYEQPEYFPLFKEPDYTAVMDGEITYNQNSWVHITFVCAWGGTDNVSLKSFLEPPPKKTPGNLVAFVTSNCDQNENAKKRVAYVRELMDYVDVHSYGKCLHNRETSWSHHMRFDRSISHGEMITNRMKLIQDYKFVLALENNNVTDYVTEKIVTTYLAGVVPIYMGAPNIEEWTPGEHSVIKVSDFKGPKDLAAYLKHLDQNDDEYYKYFDWKKKGVSPSFEKLWNNCAYFADCRMAQKIIDENGYWKRFGRLRYTELMNTGRSDCWSLSFDGVNDYVEIPHSLSLDFEYEYTLVAWTKHELFTDGRIISKETGGRLDGWGFDVTKYWSRGFLRLCAGGGCFRSGQSISLGVWNHVAVVFRLRNIQFYINGKPVGVFGYEQPTQLTRRNTLPVRIGRPASGGKLDSRHPAEGVYNGEIDEVSIWSTAKSDEEIRKLMFQRLVGNELGLAAYYGFNEGTGNKVFDLSLNGNHGTIHGPVWVPSCSKPIWNLIGKGKGD